MPSMQRLLLGFVSFWRNLLGEEHNIHRHIELRWNTNLFRASDLAVVACSYACDTETAEKNRGRNPAGNNRFHLSNDNLHARQFDRCVDVTLRSYGAPMKSAFLATNSYISDPANCLNRR